MVVSSLLERCQRVSICNQSRLATHKHTAFGKMQLNPFQRGPGESRDDDFNCIIESVLINRFMGRRKSSMEVPLLAWLSR